MYKDIEEHYKANKDKLTKQMAYRTKSNILGEEVVQEGYYRALKYNTARLEGVDLSKWIFRIIVTCYYDMLAEEKHHVHNVFEEEDVEGIEENKYGAILLAKLATLIERENEEDIEILRLYYEYGFPLRDITKIVGIKYRKVEKTIQKFKCKVNERWDV